MVESSGSEDSLPTLPGKKKGKPYTDYCQRPNLTHLRLRINSTGNRLGIVGLVFWQGMLGNVWGGERLNVGGVKAQASVGVGEAAAAVPNRHE